MAEARDPVCGMLVDTAQAPESSHDGQTWYFCSENCRTRFDANPTGYGAGARTGSGHAEAMERHEPPHTTSGPITAPKFGSAGSGGAEYEPLPEQHDEP